MTSAQIAKLIKEQGGKITSNIIKDLIKDHKGIKEKTSRLYNAYLGLVPILNRQFENPNKVNNKIPNDFRGDIVDTITGYMFGNPITYKVCDEKYEQTKLDKINAELKSFLKRNHIEDLDSRTGQIMTICGYAARLCYHDKIGLVKVMNINPWEVIFVYDSTLDELQYALIYYDFQMVDNNGEAITRTKVEWYDKKQVSFFISDDKGDYGYDSTIENNPINHNFDFIPLVKYFNSDTEQGDFEKVEDLINSYDRTISDIQNELEEFRLAYFAFFGCTPDEDSMSQAKKLGAFGFPEGSKGEFLTKDYTGVNDFVENHKKTISENIYKFSKSVDMKDEKFSGSAMSGESRKWKLVGLENKAITKERKFSKATLEMFKIITSAWSKKEILLNYEDVELRFVRNLPVDLNYQATVTSLLKGMVSEETRLSLLSFVDDPEGELQKMKDEQSGNIDLNNIPVD